jgi:hypothetical protein
MDENKTFFSLKESAQNTEKDRGHSMHLFPSLISLSLSLSLSLPFFCPLEKKRSFALSTSIFG